MNYPFTYRFQFILLLNKSKSECLVSPEEFTIAACSKKPRSPCIRSPKNCPIIRPAILIDFRQDYTK